MDNNTPPLKIWVWVGISFLIFQIFIITRNGFPVTHKESSFNIMFNALYQQLEIDFQQADSSTTKIAIIGSSLVGYGILCSDEIDYYAKKTYNKDILLKKIFLYRDQFQFLVKKQQILQKLINLNPDMVIIQTEYLTTELRRPEHKERSLLNSIEEVSKQNREFLRFEILGKKNRKHLQNCYPIAIHQKPKPIDTTSNIRALERVIKSEKDRAFVFQDLENLQKHGIKVVMLDFPRPHKVEQLAQTPVFNQNLKTLSREYNQIFGIEHWSYNKPMYFHQFIDYGHLNSTGRKVFTEWLIDEIIKETRK